MSSFHPSNPDFDPLARLRPPGGPSLPPETASSGAFTRPLTVPLLVRGAIDKAGVGCVLGGVVFLIGLGIYFHLAVPRGVGLAICVWSVAAVFLFPVLALVLWRWPRQCWLEVTVTGFVLTGRGRKQVYRDEDVVALSRRYVLYQNSTHHHLMLEVRTDEGNERIGIDYLVRPNVADPLAGFWTRLIQGRANRLGDRLSQGEQLRGDDWHVDQAGLHSRQGLVPLERISYAGALAQSLCVWQDEEERPCLRLWLGSPNVPALYTFLVDRMMHGPTGVRPLPGKPLGRVLLERRSPDMLVELYLVLPGLIVCGSLLVGGFLNRGSTIGWIILGLLAVVMAALLLTGLFFWRGRKSVLIFHEGGVVQPDRRGAKTLFYGEIGTVTWKKGPVIVLAPLRGLDRPEIRYHSSVGKVDLDLLQMRPWLCYATALRWREEIKKGPVQWAPRLRFLPGGLEYRTASLFGAGETVTVPYHLTRYQIAHGTFFLFTTEQAKAVFTERTHGPNFFPGVLLLDLIHDDVRQRASAVAPTAAPGDGPVRDERIVGEEKRFRE